MALACLIMLSTSLPSNAYQLSAPTQAITKHSAKQFIRLMHGAFEDKITDVTVRDDGVQTSYEYETHVSGKRFHAIRDISVAMFPSIGIIVKDRLPGIGVTVNMHLKETGRSRENVSLNAEVEIDTPPLFSLVPSFIMNRVLNNRMQKVEKLLKSLK